MNLIIDAGNTSVKVSVFKGDMILLVVKIDEEEVSDEIKKILKVHASISSVIVSSVSNLAEDSLKFLSESKKCVFLTYKTPIPFRNLYKTPNTLGMDRVALMASAVKEYPKKNTLVIDAGTCITYDFVNGNKEYYGGSIAPGLQMRYKSLAEYTEKLPLLSPKHPEGIIGDSTENAIHMGVASGLIAEINGVIELFSNSHASLVVILTGGDAKFLSKRLKSGIFVDPNFLLRGLNYILEYNIDK